MTKITLIAALSNNGTIGKGGQIPWHNKKDLYNFYNYTMGKPVIMGRKTHESIGRALSGRVNVILTSQVGYNPSGCIVARSPVEALLAVRHSDEVVVIGGAEVYAAFLPYANRLVLTHVLADVAGDTHFPDVNGDDWEFAGGEYHEEHPVFGYSIAIATYERAGHVGTYTAAPQPYPSWFPECPYPSDIFTMDTEGYKAALPDEGVRGAVSGYLGRMFWKVAERNMAQALDERVEDMLLEMQGEPWFFALGLNEREVAEEFVRKWMLG